MSSVTFILITRYKMRRIILPLDTKCLLGPTNNENVTLFYKRKEAHKEARKITVLNVNQPFRSIEKYKCRELILNLKREHTPYKQSL